MRRKSRGDPPASLIALLAIIAVVVLCVASGDLLRESAIEGSGSVEVISAVWSYNGSPVERVEEGALVCAVVKLSSSTGYSGYIEIRVKRDMALLPDMTVALVRQYYSVKPGAGVEASIKFRASCSPMSRGYHVEVMWHGGKYTMPSNYPPRLKVLCGD